ncbi:hypothetical protein QQS21_006651 [Conoideocrella luteorostrata]|uniref:Uncharacterized protein n=1 Tax=Conoideocrella luteorostrata TaxID=1105319 RepID=A0AAJ0FXR9_9HYPO|nr:hypothetical protein QQS21_006651 [Conoideocrella luteorostrata]
MPQAFTARAPLLLGGDTGSTTPQNHLPELNELLESKWRMVASSSSFWQDQKRDVLVKYDVDSRNGSNGMSVITDSTTYTTTSSSKQSVTKGVSTQSSSNASAYNWRGTGWLRMVTAQWEFVGFGSVGPGDSPVLVLYAQKTIFSPQSLSIYCRDGASISAEDMDLIKTTLTGLEDSALTAEVDKVQSIG